MSMISIHALREEGDGVVLDECSWLNEFLSTPSARRATARLPGRPPLDQISIHALREEGDLVRAREFIGYNNFYPRPPRGGRRSWHKSRLA